MTGSEKYTWGVILGIGGWLGLVGGIALSMTLFGACLGIPLAVIGLPVMILGIIWSYQGRLQKQQEVISAGIREGIASVQGVHLSVVPPSLPPAAETAAQPPKESAAPEAVEAHEGETTTPEGPWLEGFEGDRK